ncbi:MAG: multiheme c-type cytochrome [Pirellulaceae bacterium]|nr:multiheme c-type cytochrome [Pirellulaceae bacterium]
MDRRDGVNQMEWTTGRAVVCGLLAVLTLSLGWQFLPIPTEARVRNSELDTEKVRPTSVDIPVEPSREVRQDSKDDFEPIFQNWEKPDLALLITGRQHGYIEPCGCSGLDRAKGGLMRRHALINDLTSRGWSVVKLDLGDQIRRAGPQSLKKLKSTFEALSEVMKYDAIGLGAGELKIDSFEMLQLLMNAGNGGPASPFVSANASVFDEPSILPYRVIERNGRRIGVTSVVSTQHFTGQGDLMAAERDTKIQAPETALAKVVPKLVAEKCDALLLLAFVSERESRELAQKFPQFDFIVNEGVEGEPVAALQPIQVGNRTVNLVQMGYKSMFAGVIGIYADPNKPVQYQKITLDHRFEDTKEMKDKFKRYQDELERAGLTKLIPKPSPHPSGYQYVGSKVCADCHDQEHEVWAEGTDIWKSEHPGKVGPHSRATADLVEPGERTWVQRHHDPECLSCHVTGWNPQQYFAYETGYLNLEKDTHLHGSGCENCHGPGSRHVAIENGEESTADEKDVVLSRLRITKEEAKDRLCVQCHDLDNSPDFDFDKYWPYIEH